MDALHQGEGEDAAFPALLHFRIFAVLLFGDEVWFHDAGGIEALGLEDFEIGGDGLPVVVEDLVGVVFVDERHGADIGEAGK